MTAVAVEGNGDVAITMSFSSTILVYSPASQTFRTVSLPHGDLPSAMGTLSSGRLAVVASNNNAVDIVGQNDVGQNDVVQREAVASYGLGCGNGVCAGVANQHELYLITEHGRSGGGSSGAGSAVAVTTTSPRGVKLRLGSGATPLGDGKVLVPTTVGIAVVDPSSGATSSYALPSRQCSTVGISNPAGSSPAVAQCQEAPVAYAVDGAGNVWFTANSGKPRIYEMA
ncbi:MAG: NHL repeat-containing protein, partial [Acidimicrobiales bacterium]